MVESKKTGGKKTASKKQVKITAVIPKSLHLTQKEKQELAKALRAAGETFVQGLESKYEETIPVIASWIPHD